MSVNPGDARRDEKRILVVTDEVLAATWQALRPTADQGCEGTVRWATPRVMSDSRMLVVTTVVIPMQRASPGRFDIPHGAVREMGARLREAGLVNAAQLHTHPDEWVGHSPWDDERAYSQREGALSIVWPDYGAALPAFESWGIHESRAGKWVRLERAEAEERLIIVPSVINLGSALLVFDTDCGDEEA